MFEKRIGYYIHGRTGCTCCSSENFTNGLFVSLDETVKSVKWHRDNRTVSSQYSQTGEYAVYEVEYETLPDGRIIVGDRVLASVTDLDLSGAEANSFAGMGTKIVVAAK